MPGPQLARLELNAWGRKKQGHRKVVELKVVFASEDFLDWISWFLGFNFHQNEQRHGEPAVSFVSCGGGECASWTASPQPRMWVVFRLRVLLGVLTLRILVFWGLH